MRLGAMKLVDYLQGCPVKVLWLKVGSEWWWMKPFKEEGSVCGVGEGMEYT